jgi:hypothetical protein
MNEQHLPDSDRMTAKLRRGGKSSLHQDKQSTSEDGSDPGQRESADDAQVD